MTSMNTGSQELKYNSKTALPPLVQYKDIRNYTPAYGDFVIWSGLMTTWCGVVSNYNKESKSLSIIFSGVPFVLFTLMPSEQAKETKEMKLEDICNAPKGKFAIQQIDYTSTAAIWYI